MRKGKNEVEKFSERKYESPMACATDIIRPVVHDMKQAQRDDEEKTINAVPLCCL